MRINKFNHSGGIELRWHTGNSFPIAIESLDSSLEPLSKCISSVIMKTVLRHTKHCLFNHPMLQLTAARNQLYQNDKCVRRILTRQAFLYRNSKK